MRVFYEEEEEDISTPMRRFYIKIDNVNVPDTLRGYKLFIAKNNQDLLSKIIEFYNIHRNPSASVELWSGMGTKLDITKEIPKENDFLYAHIVLNN